MYVAVKKFLGVQTAVLRAVTWCSLELVLSNVVTAEERAPTNEELWEARRAVQLAICGVSSSISNVILVSHLLFPRK